MNVKNEDEDSFFDLLSRFQSKRMDDQRCSLSVDNKENIVNIPCRDGPDDLMDMIAGMQSKRMDEQRVALPNLPGTIIVSRGIKIFYCLYFEGLQSSSIHRLSEASKNSVPDDSFLDQLVRCQSSRLEDQRSPLPAPLVDAESEAPINQTNKSGATVPDEDFFSLIMRFQSGRMDDQRATIPRITQRYVNL